MESERITFVASTGRGVKYRKAAESRDMSLSEWIRQALDTQAELDRYHAFQRTQQGRKEAAAVGLWPSGIPMSAPCPLESCVSYGRPHTSDPAKGHGLTDDEIRLFIAGDLSSRLEANDESN